MKNYNKQLAQIKTIIMIIILITVVGIISIIYNPNLEQQHQAKWDMLQAQNASLNTLAIAKNMLHNNLLTKNCLNTAGCPFWSGYNKIRLTNKNGTPNLAWWKKNAYKILGSPHNAKFIIIKMQNDLYKIIACAEDLESNQAVISAGYF